MGYNEAIEWIGGPEAVTAGVLVKMSGDVGGIMLSVQKLELINFILETMLDQGIQGYEELQELQQSALIEVGNIMISAFVTSLSGLAGININLTVPAFAVDMQGAILTVPMAEYGGMSDYLMTIGGNFVCNGQEIPSHLLLSPDLRSLDFLLRKLGVSDGWAKTDGRDRRYEDAPGGGHSGDLCVGLLHRPVLSWPEAAVGRVAPHHAAAEHGSRTDPSAEVCRYRHQGDAEGHGGQGGLPQPHDGEDRRRGEDVWNCRRQRPGQYRSAQYRKRPRHSEAGEHPPAGGGRGRKGGQDPALWRGQRPGLHPVLRTEGHYFLNTANAPGGAIWNRVRSVKHGGGT